MIAYPPQPLAAAAVPETPATTQFTEPTPTALVADATVAATPISPSAEDKKREESIT